jgi:hypothetical protein
VQVAAPGSFAGVLTVPKILASSRGRTGFIALDTINIGIQVMIGDQPS